MKLTPNPEFAVVNPAVRKKWHDALIACNKPQARKEMLSTEGGYCCLMVGHTAFGGDDSSRTEALPKDCSPFVVAITSIDPFIALDDKGQRVSAGVANDRFNLTFAEIAKLVYPEAYPKPNPTRNKG